MSDASPIGSNSRTIYAVSDVAEILRGLLEDSLPNLWVQGEISNLAKPASGHWYFTLKDERAQLRCAMFRNSNLYVRPPPANGDAVLIRGKVGIYPARGELQMIVDHMEPAGTGALLRAFEALKARLAAEGLFDQELKRPLPETPRRIGLITSGTGAAVHDVLTTLARRWPLAEVFLYPVPVQGAEAPPAIVRALSELPRRAPVDVILLVRGGGSLEDLWAFNEEAVARAIRACAVPVVTGVGHEVDVTIADFVSDLRAATPTAAAELATPDIAEWAARVENTGEQLLYAMQEGLERSAEQVSRMQARLGILHPGRRLQERAQRLDELDERLRHAWISRLGTQRDRLQAQSGRLLRADPSLRLQGERRHIDSLAMLLRSRMQTLLGDRGARLTQAQALLDSLNPEAVLARGYAIVRDEHGAVLQDAAQARPGSVIEAQLARGSVTAEVREARNNRSPGSA
ncbi:exodeoxyribonuclease VII large subunit [Nevskia soli]|uniref:exodeoxyribonuclease VII large subunit n=1 Tax=Nevskia soli TaxID=418856 RepID=UPI0004A6BA4D|nr:exodeoxyribonuclease VII large subunit [Nevskia soli]